MSDVMSLESARDSGAQSAGAERTRPSQRLSVLPAIPGGPAASLREPRGVARYQRIRALGAGGNGEVDLWQDQDIHRQVAVKRLKHIGSPESLSQFVREVQITGQLEHPGIVPIYDVGVDEEGNYFFVMKHAEGETLKDLIAKLREGNSEYRYRYSYEMRTQIFMQILRAVQYAHKKGFLHCDIKPANVIVGPFGEVMLLDWGLAKRIDEDEQVPTAPPQARARAKLRELRVSGTPDYMAPEQAKGGGEKLDVRTDTYSLCVLFHELITLDYYLRPVSTVVGRLTSILTEEPLTGVQMHHKYGAPPELTNYIRKGLEKDPNRRYQTVDEMIEGLQAVIDGLIPVACPCTGVKRAGHHYSDLLNERPLIGLALLGVISLFTLFGVVEAVRLGIRLLYS